MSLEKINTAATVVKTLADIFCMWHDRRQKTKELEKRIEELEKRINEKGEKER